MTISVTAYENASGKGAADLLAQEKQQRSLHYSASEDGWYVASWSVDNQVVYKRAHVNPQRCCVLEFTYPSSDDADALLEDVAETFNPGF